jgi:murein DD-endopeptidase MepM/ murein hydrolase activator NlpD
VRIAQTGGGPRWVRTVLGLLCAAALVPAPAALATGLGGKSHEVRRSETLTGIARRYGVSVREIVAANRLAGPRARLQAGRRLAIPETASARRPAFRPRPAGRGGVAARRAALPSPFGRDVFALPPAGVVLGIPDLPEATPAFAWPVEGAVSSRFGRRWQGWHRGVDIVAVEGTPIRAAAAGVVIASGVEPRYGRVVKIEHDHGFVSVYAHNLANRVEIGYRVAAGQEIGHVGQTGFAIGAHLHFEIRHEGRAINPLYLLPLPPRVATEESVEPEEDDE